MSNLYRLCNYNIRILNKSMSNLRNLPYSNIKYIITFLFN